MSQEKSNVFKLIGLVLAVALSGAGAAHAETPAAVPPDDRTVLDFVGQWPPDTVSEHAGSSQAHPNDHRDAHHAVRPNLAADEGIDCVQWAFSRVAALWHATLNTMRTAWLRARATLFGAPD